MKKCTKCKKRKLITEFYKNLRYKDGYVSWCKKCVNKKASYCAKQKTLKIISARKSVCKNCNIVFSKKHKTKFCKETCRKKWWAKENWRRQKNRPRYSKYHRDYMRDWAKKKYWLNKFGGDSK